MNYVISFSDVMSGAITIVLGILTFLIKGWFTETKKTNDKLDARITKLEEKTDGEIESIKKEITDIKGDFATTFVLREDFFRTMNGVEDKIRGMDNKLDKLLLMRKE